MSFITKKQLSVKQSNFSEASIRDYLAEKPELLGLGDLQIHDKERPTRYGRIDLILQNDDAERYIVELQLGSLDPSHIIRSIEYWNHQRDAYPQYVYKVVLVAEEFSRYLEVLAILGNIPFIAIKASLYEGNQLQFEKVYERVIAEDNEHESDNNGQYDRAYWEGYKPTKLKVVDQLFGCVKELNKDISLKYNKFYIGIGVNGSSNNFIYFSPKQTFVYLNIRSERSTQIDNQLNDLGFDFLTKDNYYKIRLQEFPNEAQKTFIIEMVKSAMKVEGIYSE